MDYGRWSIVDCLILTMHPFSRAEGPPLLGGIHINKLDLIKQLHALYHPSAKEVSRIDVPEMNFLMIDGTGDPNSAPAYAEALTALYQLSYTIKFSLKKASGR